MKANDLHQTIAAQVDNMRPAHLTPGQDVQMQVIDEITVRVLVRRPAARLIDIRYDAGPDTYTVTRYTIKDGTATAGEPLSDVYCDQLGELVFGEVAEDWTLPFVVIESFDADGNVDRTVI
jgi:hypothetical protein